MELRRGDVYWVDFDLSLGEEINKTRPAIIVSNDSNNFYANRVQVIPITSSINRVYPCETIVLIGAKQGKAMADQLATVSKSRIKNKICTLTTDEILSVERIIKLQLGLTVVLN